MFPDLDLDLGRRLVSSSYAAAIVVGAAVAPLFAAIAAREARRNGWTARARFRAAVALGFASSVVYLAIWYGWRFADLLHSDDAIYRAIAGSPALAGVVAVSIVAGLMHVDAATRAAAGWRVTAAVLAAAIAAAFVSYLLGV